MAYASRVPILILATALASALTGCNLLEPGTRSQTGQPNALLSPPDAASYIRKEWLPGTGRMVEPVRRRHYPIGPTESILYADRFDRTDGQPPISWKSVGSTGLRPVHVDGRAGTEIFAPANPVGECGLERELQPVQLRGRDVRLDLELACASTRRREALRGVRISLNTADAAGQTREIFLPVAVDASPGWETIHWWLRFRSDVGSATLRLHLIQPDASITVGELAMTAVDSPPEPPAVVPATTTRPNGPRINLIAGGSFETGRRLFFASLLRQWPDGEESLAPLPFDYDNEAVVGERSLRLQIGTGTGRIGFGPLDLTAAGVHDPITWELKFFAHTAKPASLTASLRIRGRTLARMQFPLMPEWQAFAGTFTVPYSATDRSALSAAELVFDLPNRDPAGTLEVWLDGVSLTDTPTTEYLQAEPIEVGITGPVPLTADLSHIVAEETATTFQVSLAANPFNRPPAPEPLFALSRPAPATSGLSGPAGKLALDLLDGWDRAAWTRTTEPVMSKTGKYSEKVSLALPRGYYRLLATLWTGEPGRSRLISHDECPVAVISFRDPVPMGNRFGLSTAGGCCSGYTTALGAGWVRMDLSAQRVEIKPGVWDLAQWQAQTVAAKQANIEIIAGLTLPAVERFHRTFLDQWLAGSALQPIGLVVSPPAISTRPVEEYFEELNWVSQVLATASSQTRLVCDLSALDLQTRERPASDLPRGASFAIGYASTEGGLPENSEPLLESIGKRYMADLHVWDLGVPVRLSGVSGPEDWRALATSRGLEIAPVARMDPPLDPILSASRMVRSILVRALASAQLVCCEATALSASASIYDNDRQRLHERDLTPRPALVVFERMTSLLNDATLSRWIDLPGGCRILYFDKDDGGAVAVVWRCFGLNPTYLRLAGLPAKVTVLDCLGQPAPPLPDGDNRLLEVNEMVRYIVAPAGQSKALSDVLDAARIQSAQAQSQPAK